MHRTTTKYTAFNHSFMFDSALTLISLSQTVTAGDGEDNLEQVKVMFCILYFAWEVSQSDAMLLVSINSTVLYMLLGGVMVPSGVRSCSEPCVVTFLELCVFLSFSHISNGRRHTGSQRGGGGDTGEGGVVIHIWLACPWKRMVGGSFCPWHAISWD